MVDIPGRWDPEEVHKITIHAEYLSMIITDSMNGRCGEIEKGAKWVSIQK
jgi:hypothetical protein